MNMTIRPMTEDEVKYTYRQSQQLAMQCGSIGYLRGDFGGSGGKFFTTWEDTGKLYKTEDFQAEFDVVINALRSNDKYGGILKDRDSMRRYGMSHPDSVFPGNYCTEYGFRADTKDYAYLLRCNPNMDDYNFYVFPYVSEWLDRNIENARQGIRFIDSQYKELFRIKDGNVITLTFDDGDNVSRVCRYIDEYHTEVGSELYHICQFAEIMERTGTKYEPAAPLPKDEKKPKPKNKEHER